jgi:hypothetical protein
MGRIGWAEQDRQNKTGRTGQAEKDMPGSTDRMRLPGQDMTARKGQLVVGL